LQELREARAELVNVDPRPAQDGDHCQVSLESIAGLEGAPVKQDDLNIEIGAEQTMAPFTEALRGANRATSARPRSAIRRITRRRT
jgi:trigger factor